VPHAQQLVDLLGGDLGEVLALLIGEAEEFQLLRARVILAPLAILVLQKGAPLLLVIDGHGLVDDAAVGDHLAVVEVVATRPHQAAHLKRVAVVAQAIGWPLLLGLLPGLERRRHVVGRVARPAAVADTPRDGAVERLAGLLQRP